MTAHLKEELVTLQENITLVAEKLRSNSLSSISKNMASELLLTLLLVEEKIENEGSSGDNEKINLVVSKLPLLYLQIRKIS